VITSPYFTHRDERGADEIALEQGDHMSREERVSSNKRAGRIIGALLLVQAILAVPVFTEIGMMRAVISPQFLAGAAASAIQIRIALLLLMVLGGITLAVAIEGLPIFRRHGERMALVFLALSVIGMAGEAAESHVVRSMLSMSIQYNTPGAQHDVLEALSKIARSAWASTHFTNLLMGHLKVFVLFLILFRSALVPRGLAAIGITATILSNVAAIRGLLGYRFLYPLIAPAGLCVIALAVWLLVKGFRESEQSLQPVESREGAV
jgi:hypothetical protein